MTLAEFLNARLADAEALANAAAADWDAEVVRYEWEDLPDEVYSHARLHDPARVLRQIEATRQILTLSEQAEEDGDTDAVAALYAVMEGFAAVDSDHPDHREDWS